MSNVRFEFATQDARPAVIFDHVQDASVNALSAQIAKESESALRFIESKDVLLSATRLLAPAAVFLEVGGAGSENISVDGGDVSKAAKTVAFQNGGVEKAVKLRV